LVAAGLLSEQTVIKELTHAAVHAGLDKREIQATIRSGLTYGLSRRREIPEREPYEYKTSHNGHTHAAQDPEDEPCVFEPKPFLAKYLENIPKREWVYGHFLINQFISVLGAPGGTGKSAYAFAVAISVALGLPLLNEKVHEPGKVWIYNLEDPEVELWRRIAAVCRHYKIDPTLLEGKLFVDSGRDRPLCIARSDGPHKLIAEPIVDAMIEAIQRLGITLLIVDPFVRSHRLEENRNEHIDFAAALWAYIADKAGCTILLVHHFRKGGVSGEADSFRGASALIDASRAAVSLARMTEDEANRLGIELRDRRRYLRIDNAKMNLAAPPEETTWLKLVSVPLDNGDEIQAVERWDVPSPWDGMPWTTIINILDKIDAGPEDGERYSDNKQAKERWASQVVIDMAGRTERQASAIIKSWCENGILEERDYISKRLKRTTKGLYVNQSKLAEMPREIIESSSDD
jgi:hypothetical protein